MADSSVFGMGKLVALKSNKNIQGAIIGIIEGSPENRYQVFTQDGLQTYYESQIESLEIQSSIKTVKKDEFDAGITASLIRNPSLSSLYSLNSAKIDFIPHQFRPVLKFIHSDRPRLLIADSVGVGKTIEAGLILKELEARRNVDSILIICPRALVAERKWEMEMERFGEDFTALDGNSFRYCINELEMEGEWPEKYKKAVIPYSLFDEANLFGGRKNPGLMEVDPPKFDLVIVDEAHHIRNTATFAYRAVNLFCENAEAVVFLTATPVQLYDKDLYVLLNILRPDLIIDQKTFGDMAEPNEYINKASAVVRGFGDRWQETAMNLMNRASNTEWGRKIYTGNPVFERIIRTLSQHSVTPEERVQLISDIENMHTFSNLINRTRRRDIGEFTVRRPYTVEVQFTDYQRELHDKILSVIHDILSQVYCTLNIKFLMTTIRRQTASCLFGLAPMLKSILYHHVYEIMDEDESFETNAFDIDSSSQTVRERINEILVMAEDLPEEDPKFDAMLEVIEKKQLEENNKIMIFSTFRHTLNYLEKKLIKAGKRSAVIHGGVPDEERRSLRRRFDPKETPSANPEALDILLFSEVGCEGLDYQFCDCMINYDLPWNPMKIEQRIGRIDRNGQKSESVSIYNMITSGTVDSDIYYRCMERIDVFRKSVGDCESIFGELTSEINKLYNDLDLTDEERRNKMQQMTDNRIRLIKEQEELEEKQRDLFGVHVPESAFDTELKKATNFWLSSEMIRNMVSCYLNHRLGVEREYLLGSRELKRLRISQEGRLSLLDDFKEKKYPRNEVSKSWRRWLELGDQILNVTFDSQCWKENPNAVFLTFTHPLVQMAADYLRENHDVMVSLAASSDRVPAGEYPFAVYQWKYSGENEDLQLKTISADDTLNEYLFELLKTSGNTDAESKTDSAVFDAIDQKHHEIWEKALKEYRDAANELIRYKEASLKTSHAARINALKAQLTKNNKQSYIQMTQGKLKIAEQDFALHMAKLENARNRTDILFELLAYGMLTVENKAKS